ncbi:MAG: MATE family efflux transporter [Chloroflexi bacterium]|nr:MATE family efflux transporter [Chloroflexota bacterium]
MSQVRSRSSYATRDLTQGSIPRNLWFLGWPQIVSGAVSAVDEMVDLFWSGFISSRAMASVGVGQTWIMLFNSARMGLDTSARAMVSRAVGAADLPLANHIAYQSILINTGLTLLILGSGIAWADLLWKILGVTDTLSEDGLAYQRLRFLASIFFGANNVCGSLLTAGGDSLTPMKAQLLARGLHIVLTPLFMFGFGPLPGMGILGGPVAHAIGHAAGGIMNFRALIIGSSRLHLRYEGLKVDPELAVRQLRIGAPASVTSAERALSNLVLVGIVAPFGATAIAVYSVTQRLQQLTSFAGQGLAQASGVIVGQSLGARQTQRARATVWWALAYVGGLQVVLCVVMFLFPEAFIFAFSREPEVIEVASQFLRIGVLGILLLGAANVLALAFNTAGDTGVAMWSNLGTLWLIQQPAAVALTGASSRWQPFGLQVLLPEAWNVGFVGVAWAIVIASVVRFLSMFLYFLWGPWWNKQVLVRSAVAGEGRQDPVQAPARS